MRSVRFARFGEPIDVLEVVDLPVPEVGPGQMLIRMRARPVNPSDLLTVRGLYGVLPRLPASPGFEGVGVIEAVGSEAEEFHVGRRVIPVGARGTWQEYLLAGSDEVIPCPDAVEDFTAAQFVVNALSAWVMTTEELALRPGEWLLQTAAGSALGRMVIQISRLRGFRTINVVRRREQVEELRRMGADEVICSADGPIVERVMAVTGQAGVRAAIDAVGGRLGGKVASVLGRGGTMLVYGLLSLEHVPLNTGRMIFSSTTVRGFWLDDWFRRTPPAKQRESVEALLGLMAAGEVVPAVEAEYDLKDVVEAVRHAARPGRRGKILLVG
ncbi:MAG TPA: zinc-dependent alcohol dehydrogenase family protein [Pyrinomonadaceae bacterium]|jgi:NADPH:quinone reductase-like Zn-dependent oxidoreductase|nr:zinc-dependent alcohol dehydrogenase family protein [Pyrinomonadaceae bacterium]